MLKENRDCDQQLAESNDRIQAGLLGDGLEDIPGLFLSVDLMIQSLAESPDYEKPGLDHSSAKSNDLHLTGPYGGGSTPQQGDSKSYVWAKPTDQLPRGRSASPPRHFKARNILSDPDPDPAFSREPKQSHIEEPEEEELLPIGEEPETQPIERPIEREPLLGGFPAFARDWSEMFRPLIELRKLWSRREEIGRLIRHLGLFDRDAVARISRPLPPPTPTHCTMPKRSLLPITVNGKSEYAVPDSGVTANVMTVDMASSLGVVIDRDPAKKMRFTNATMGSFQALGISKIELVFDTASGKTWSCEFAIVKKCAAPIVLGKAFLDAAEIFTRFRHRLIKAALTIRGNVGKGLEKVWRLMLMDKCRQRLRCQIDGELALATADSGSDVDLVSNLYAQSRGWQMTPLPHDEGYVILADEKIVKLSGYVDADLAIQGKITTSRFYVLDGLASEVILGDGTIEESQIFLEHADLFVDMPEDGIDDKFLMIQWVERFDTVERIVDDMLKASSNIADMTVEVKPCILRSLFSRRPQRAHANDTALQLRHRLDEVDNIEADCLASVSKSLTTLTGKAYKLEVKLDQKRRARHRQLRQKIIEAIDKSLNRTNDQIEMFELAAF